MNQVSRRSFIKNAGGASVALWLGLSNKFFAGKQGDVFEANFTPYIIVESNGDITLFNTKPEMGQGTFQSIPALIAEEFEVRLDQVTIKYQRRKTIWHLVSMPAAVLLFVAAILI